MAQSYSNKSEDSAPSEDVGAVTPSMLQRGLGNQALLDQLAERREGIVDGLADLPLGDWAGALVASCPELAAVLAEDPVVVAEKTAELSVTQGSQAAYDWEQGPPGDMPWNVAWGIHAHNLHLSEAQKMFAGHDVVGNHRPMKTLVRQTRGEEAEARLRNPDMKPDVYVMPDWLPYDAEFPDEGPPIGYITELKHRSQAGSAAPEARIYQKDMEGAGMPSRLTPMGDQVDTVVQTGFGPFQYDVHFEPLESGATQWYAVRREEDEGGDRMPIPHRTPISGEGEGQDTKPKETPGSERGLEREVAPEPREYEPVAVREKILEWLAKVDWVKVAKILIAIAFITVLVVGLILLLMKALPALPVILITLLGLGAGAAA